MLHACLCQLPENVRSTSARSWPFLRSRVLVRKSFEASNFTLEPSGVMQGVASPFSTICFRNSPICFHMPGILAPIVRVVVASRQLERELSIGHGLPRTSVRKGFTPGVGYCPLQCWEAVRARLPAAADRVAPQPFLAPRVAGRRRLVSCAVSYSQKIKSEQCMGYTPRAWSVRLGCYTGAAGYRVPNLCSG